MVQRCHCHGLDFVLYQARSQGPTPYLPGSHRMFCPRPTPLSNSKYTPAAEKLTIILGGHLRCILPSSFHLALLANRTEQIRAAN